ncbi:MAG: exosortase/archaeosortase family protein [Planctomycetota bacterium]|jgi:exosortase
MAEKDNKSGRLADLVDEAPAPARSINRQVLVKMGVLAGALIAINWRQFTFLWDDWQMPNWSHGYLIPLFSLFLVYSRFGEIISVRRRTCWWGLPFVLGAAGLHVVGYWLRNPWSCQVTMVLLAAALVLFLAGWRMFRVVWLPILYLVFALPIPDMLYERVSLPLQNFAAANSTVLLSLFGIGIENQQSLLLVTTVTGEIETLRVAEACSGMRLLMAFLALSVAMAYLTDRPIWQRVILVGMGVPVAVFANVLRVGITTVMFYLDKAELGQDFMHEFTGLLMLIPAALALWLAAWLMERLFVEDDSEEAAPAGQVE